MKLIVGLGNPGKEYMNNRHNVGFQCLERFAQAKDLTFNKRQLGADLAFGEMAGIEIVLARPLSFVNASGRVVKRLLDWYGIELANLLVTYDDLDLPLGKIRLRARGGAGGHKGVRSIINHLESQDFPRLRVGIGPPPTAEGAQSYVLSDFKPGERLIIEETYLRVIEAIECYLTQGIAVAMNQFNGS